MTCALVYKGLVIVFVASYRFLTMFINVELNAFSQPDIYNLQNYESNNWMNEIKQIPSLSIYV